MYTSHWHWRVYSTFSACTYSAIHHHRNRHHAGTSATKTYLKMILRENWPASRPLHCVSWQTEHG